jgi:hypothetical protein
MGFGAITWACLLWTVHAETPQPYLANLPPVAPVNLRGFTLPVRLKPEMRTGVAHLLLYVSPDQGRTWQLRGKMEPEQEGFKFQADGDGEFWFIVATENAAGEQNPPNVYRVAPHQRVLVDTVRPDVQQISAERQGDGVLVRWKIEEAAPDPSSLVVSYHLSDAPPEQWTPIAVPPALEGQKLIPGLGNAEVHVRVQIKDTAGNIGMREATVQGEAGGAGRMGATGGPSFTGANWPADKVLDPAGRGSGQPGAAAHEARSLSGGPDFQPPGGSHGVSTAGAMTPIETPKGTGRPSGPPPPPEPVGPAFPASGSSAAAASSSGLPFAQPAQPPPSATPPGTLSEISSGTALNTPPPGGGETAGSLQPVQVVNKKQVNIEFNVHKCGPSGLGGVDVYITTDDGANWLPWNPASGQPKMSVSAADTGGRMRGSVAVELAQEGTVYGFYVVVKNKVGVCLPPPQPGRSPQVRLELDATLPKAALYSPRPDPGQPNALMLHWKAEDRNLTETPITLEWTENEQAGWRPISTRPLPNTGSYSWQLPPNVPGKVFLRLSVRDRAGNVAIARTNQPIPIDLQPPEIEQIHVVVH